MSKPNRRWCLGAKWGSKIEHIRCQWVSKNNENVELNKSKGGKTSWKLICKLIGLNKSTGGNFW